MFSGSLGGATATIPGLPPPAPLYLDPGSYTVDNGSGGVDVAWTGGDPELGYQAACESADCRRHTGRGVGHSLADREDRPSRDCAAQCG